ncbi:hypothetical protein I6F11_04350 [Ensifer sp. NBAIM29]|nr:hypothetical protein [Ensifer sp. NBAIM29]
MSMFLPGCDTPVTLREDDIREVIPQPKEPSVRNRRKPLYDNPDRGE